MKLSSYVDPLWPSYLGVTDVMSRQLWASLWQEYWHGLRARDHHVPFRKPNSKRGREAVEKICELAKIDLFVPEVHGAQRQSTA